MGLLNRIGLQHRITLLIGLTVAAAIAASVYLGTSAVDETEETARREQLLSTAQVVADHVDDVLTRTKGREEHLARMVASAWSQGEPQLTNLLDAYPRLLFESDLYLLRPQGELVWSMRPGVSIPGGLSAEPLVAKSVDTLQSTVGSCSAVTTQDRSRACFASPVLLEDDEAAGVLLAQIDLDRPDLDLFSLEQLNQDFRIELVSADGLVLAANQPGEGQTSARVEAVAALASQQRSGDDVHDEPAADDQESHPVGYAPISAVPEWGVVVEPRDPSALAVAGNTKERMWLLGLAVLALLLIAVWVGIRQVFGPLRTLAARATQMAAEDLSPCRAGGRRDEVGALAQALENLRRLGARRGRLLGGLLVRHEGERQHIARELHEGTVQSLAALALGLDLLEDELVTAKEPTRERLTRSRTLALALIQDLRRLAVGLRPPALDDLGLAPALQSYAESCLSEKGVLIQLDASGVTARPSPLLETSLYRVAQEALDNVAAHAEAKTIRIRLQSDRQRVAVAVDDDGDGFDPTEVLADPDAVRGLGILSMRERMALLGGTFKIESAPGHGTRVYADVPLEENR